MTFDELKKHAYYSHPIPDGLTDTEHLQFIIARCVYSGYRCGEIDQTEAKPMMGFIERYPHLPNKEKRALLQYAFALLCENAGKGDRDALDDSKFVAQIYRSEHLKGELILC